MDHTMPKAVYIIKLAAAKPPPTLRYASVLAVYGPFVFSPHWHPKAIILNNINPEVDVKMIWTSMLLLIRIAVFLLFETCG